MSKDFSFDVVSEVDLQLIDDAVNVSMKEIINRFDLKDSGAKIEFDREKKTVTLTANADFQLDQIKQILISKIAKRNFSPKIFSPKPREKALGGNVREINELVCGIEKELAKKIIKDIKDTKLKVQVAIQDDKLRITGRDKDVLQEVISFLRSKDYPIPLQFCNYR
jgi:cyclic-di-GMP-binding protein